MNSAGLAVWRFQRSLFFASFVSNGLLRIDSRAFKDLGVIRRSRPRLKEGREPEFLAISNRPRTSMFAPAPTYVTPIEFPIRVNDWLAMLEPTFPPRHAEREVLP